MGAVLPLTVESEQRKRMNTYFTLKALFGGTEKDLGSTFRSIADNLSTADETARLQFRILGAQGESCWCVQSGTGTSQVRQERVEHPDFEMIATEDSWRDIARGSLAPFRAFLQGKARLRGNLQLGARLLQRLASPDTPTSQKGT